MTGLHAPLRSFQLRSFTRQRGSTLTGIIIGLVIGLGIAVVGLIMLGVSLTISARRGEGGEIGGWLGRLLIGVIIISAAFTIVGFLVGA